MTEIRVHGVGGGTPQQLLEQTGVVQVTGDDTAGLYRGAVGVPNRTVEAYSWGGLTARSKTRALWVLLLPFSMINLAGWMVEPDVGEGLRPTRATRWHEGVVMAIALVTTAMYVMWVALVAMNIAAFQCGAIPECVQGRPYLAFLQNDVFRDHVGRRLVVAMVVPVGLLGLFVWLGKASRSVYDAFGEPAAAGDADEKCASVLCKPEFWFTGPWQGQASRLHTAGVLALLGGLLARAAWLFHARFQTGRPAALGVLLFGAGMVVALAALVVVGAMAAKYDTLVGRNAQFVKTTRALWWASVLVVSGAAVLAWGMAVPDAQLAPAGADGVRRAVTDLWGFGWAPVLLLWLALALVLAFSIIQVWRWIIRPHLYLDQFVVPMMIGLLFLWPLGVGGPVLALLCVVAVVYLPALRRRRGPGAVVRGRAVAAATIGLSLVLHVVDGAWRPWSGGNVLAPLLVFTAILTFGLALPMEATGRRAAEAQAARSPAVLGYVAAVAALPVAAGWVLASRGNPWWLYGGAGVAFVSLSMIWLARFEDASYRGWRWNGPGALSLVALSLIAGAFSGGMMRLVDVLDGDGSVFTLHATAVYEWIAVGFAAALIAATIGVIAWAGYVFVAHARVARAAARSRLSGLNAAAAPTAKRVALLEVLAKTVGGTDVVVTLLASLMLAGWLGHNIHLFDVHGMSFHDWIEHATPVGWERVVRLASWVAVGLAIGAFVAIRRSLRDAGFRTKIGVLWDVASFWPRNFHPFAPPAYAVRAVPELQARIEEIAEAGGSTILSGHSQGSVVSLAAVASLPPQLQRRVWLVTHGSPIGRLYSTYFPRYFTDPMLQETGRALGDQRSLRDGSWLNFYRPTDPIGGPVLAHVDASGPDEAGPPPALSQALRVTAAAPAPPVRLPDVHLFDPPTPPPNGRVRAPAVRGHSGYLADQAMSDALDALARSIASGQSAPPP